MEHKPSSFASTSSSTASPPKRIRHRRRASQPAFVTTSTSATITPDFNISPAHLYSLAPYSRPLSPSSDEATSSSSSEAGTDEECDSHERLNDSAKHLDYLDLPLSLPFRLVTARSALLSYISILEERVQALYHTEQWSSHELGGLSKADASAIIQSQLARFQAQLEGVKEDLRKLALLLPSPSTFPLPLPRALPNLTIRSPSAVFAAGSQSLASEWERISAALQVRIALPTPSYLSTVQSPFQRLNVMSSLAAPGQAGARILENLGARFEVLQDLASSLTLSDYIRTTYSPSTDAGEGKSAMQAPTQDSYAASALARKFELHVIDLTSRASAQASAVIARAGEKARDAEELMYLAALELANAAGRGGRNLIRYEHLPTLWKNNEHIHSGYRFIPVRDWPALVRSVFELHNETWNIHSHLWGIFIVIPLFWPHKGLDPDTTPMDRFVQTLYLVAAIKCLVCSVGWHVMAGCSDACWFERFACVDFTGIALLISASVWTVIYNSFYCQPNLAILYSGTTLVVGLIGATVPWAPWFNKREAKPWRIALFLAMCFTALAPFTHAAFQHGVFKTVAFLSPILPSLAFYVGGLVFYATQYPESSAPGRFDLGVTSHVIWHIAIVLAILLHHRAALLFHAERFDFSCLASAPSRSDSPFSSVMSAAGGLRGVEALMRADERVHHGRQILGALGGGKVGLVWDTVVDWLQATW